MEIFCQEKVFSIISGLLSFSEWAGYWVAEYDGYQSLLCILHSVAIFIEIQEYWKVYRGKKTGQTATNNQNHI